MTIRIIISVLGGLGLFILGMNMMSEGLQKAAGEKLRRLLELMTFNRYIAVFSGLLITVLVQSSSITTVMVVGFVNAGLMNLTQAVGTILGANIGTTITAQIIAFNISEVALPAIAIGVLLSLFVKRRLHQNIGQGILGFGLIFLGLSLMGSELKLLKDYPAIVDMLAMFGQHKFLGMLAGMLFTALIQSSSASTATIIVLVSQGVLGLDSAMALVLGTNIGTCITAMLAGIGTGLNARRAAIAHILFNVIGVLAFLLIINTFTELVRGLSSDVARQVAWGHTLFNVSNTIVFLPFVTPFVKVITRIVPGTDEVLEAGPKYLDKNLLNTPSVAMGAVEREIERMAELAVDMIDDAMAILTNNDLSSLKKLERKEDVVDGLEKDISIYLASLAHGGLNEEQSRDLASYLHAVNDIERIGDHSENIASLLREKIEDNYPFSESAVEELKEMYTKVRNITTKAISSYRTKNKALAREILIDDNEIDRMEKRLRQRHVGRINEGRCFPPSGVLYLDIIANFERIGDHATNIAQVVLGDF